MICAAGVPLSAAPLLSSISAPFCISPSPASSSAPSLSCRSPESRCSCSLFLSSASSFASSFIARKTVKMRTSAHRASTPIKALYVNVLGRISLSSISLKSDSDSTAIARIPLSCCSLFRRFTETWKGVMGFGVMATYLTLALHIV